MERRKFLKLAGTALPGLAASRSLAGRLDQRLPRLPDYGPDPDPATLPAPVTRKLLVITFNPRLRSQGGIRMHRHLGWYDPDWLLKTHIRDLRFASYGYANYVVVENIPLNDFSEFPPRVSGIPFSEEGYLAAWPSRNFNPSVDSLHYDEMMSMFRIRERINGGEIDEVWTIGPPYVGRWESFMVGPGASNPNTLPPGTEPVVRRFSIMGYTHDRLPGLMLHSYGHRAAGHLSLAHSRVSNSESLWHRFRRINLTHPGMAEVGQVHFPPNGVRDYDLANTSTVRSNCDDWYHFPHLNGNRFRMVNNAEWNGGGERMYQLWWLRHLPHVNGECDGIAFNWWRYIVDPQTIDTFAPQ